MTRDRNPLVKALETVLEDRVSGCLINLGLIPLLLIVSLLLPPISLGARMFSVDYPVITQAGGSVMDPDGTVLTIPEGAVTDAFQVEIRSIPRAACLEGNIDSEHLAMVEKLPQQVEMKSPLYDLLSEGGPPSEAVLTVPIPNDSEPVWTLDLYGWNGEAWDWMPAHVLYEDDVIVAQLSRLPEAFTVVQSQSTAPYVTAILSDDGELAGAATAPVDGDALVEINPQGLFVRDDGTIAGAPEGASALSEGRSYSVIPTISNRIDGVNRSDVVGNIIINQELRRAHIKEIVDLAVQNLYSGMDIAYFGMEPELRQEFSVFIEELAAELHANDKLLTVQVDPPEQIAADRWQTGGYDWQAMGRVVDGFKVPAITDPEAYVPGGQAEVLLRYAIGEVNRRKVQLVISTYSKYRHGDGFSARPYDEALAVASTIARTDGQGEVEPGRPVSFQLSNLAPYTGLRFNEAAQTYWFAYRAADGSEYTIWLEDGGSIAHKLRMVYQYNLRGVAVQNLLEDGNDGQVWTAISQFAEESLSSSTQKQYDVVWTVADASGNEILRSVGSLSDSNFTSLIWTTPLEVGQYIISAAISDDGGQTARAKGEGVTLTVAVAATPTPQPTPEPETEPVVETEPESEAPEPTAEPQPAIASITPTQFGYGIQPDMLSDGNLDNILNHVQAMGFGWVKQQVEYFRFNPAKGQYNWAELDRIADGCQARGVKVMFSVVKAPGWSRPPGDTDEGPPADPQDYADFVGAMAAHFKGRVQAYEVWNEQNLYYEWGGRGGKLNAAKYMDLLKLAYPAIKAADPGAIVISGALTPTGMNDGDIAIRDSIYLEQMYQNGLKDYSDAVGAHPSGYNNPPDADWQTYQDPTAGFGGKGDPSWFFRGTMETYRNIMVKYGDADKKIWPTEFGWASVQGLGVAPVAGYGYAADNTEAEQAEFITQAYQMGKSWGWVGTMFLWNLNFAPVSGAADEKAAFGIVRDDWSPRAAFDALAAMPK